MSLFWILEYILTCAPNEDSNQPAHLRSLFRAFIIRMKKLCILGYPKCAKWRFWSDCANAQADLNLRSAYMSEGTFSDVTTYLSESGTLCFHYNIAVTWEIYLWTCASREDPDLPVHPRSLIKVFYVNIKISWTLGCPQLACTSRQSDQFSLSAFGCPWRAERKLISLTEGWSESSLDKHVQKYIF